LPFPLDGLACRVLGSLHETGAIDAQLVYQEETMKSRIAFWQMALALALLLGPRPAAAADPTSADGAAGPTVVRVLVVQTDNLDAYLKEIERGRALLKRLEIPEVIRVFQARFAGPEAGAVVVTVEFPSMAALAEAEVKTAADAEYQTWLKGLDKLRKIISDSLYNEL
jgi:hypothetical protein